MIWSRSNGEDAGANPWQAGSLEWQTPEYRPGHGNFGKELPVVYRWAYAFGMPGAAQDFVPQNLPPDQVATHVGNQVPGLQGGGH